MTTDYRQQASEGREAEILFSRTVKAGQRIYYIDVKRNRKGEKYLSITESKKMYSGTQEMPQVSFEKHKIFLFREDFGKFEEALRQAFDFAEGDEVEAQDTQESQDSDNGGDAIKLDMEF
jgi:hypothetical protein